MLSLDEVVVNGIADLTRFSFPLGKAGAGSVALPVNNCGGCTDSVAPITTLVEAMASIRRMPDGTFGVGGIYLPGGQPFTLDAVYDDLPSVMDPAQTKADLQDQFVQDKHFLSPSGTSIGPDYQLLAGALGNPAEQGAGANEIITFDPSQLVAISQSSRIVYWKER